MKEEMIMKTKSKTNKISMIILLAMIITMIPFSSGCGVPRSVKKEAEENKAQYEDAFRKKVEDELGPDYKLTGVECEIIDISLYGEYRVNRYMASSSLKGKLEHGGETYDVEYYFSSGNISTDALYPIIIGDLATTLGLDKDKIVFGDFVASVDWKHEKISSNIRTFESFLKDYCGSRWFFIIVTTEDISNKKYTDLSPLLHELKMENLPVCIYSTDNMTDLEHFKKNYGKIGWSTPTMFNKSKKLELPDYMEGEKDVFTRYNFKTAARLEYYPYGMDVLSYD